MSNYLLSLLAATAFAMQASPAKPTVPTKDTLAAMTLTGCVSPDATTPGSYTFSDTRTGIKYRLSGVDVQKDSAKRSEISVGSGAWRVTIRGGLVPSPNAAAQAGAIDPAHAAIASQPSGTAGGGTGRVPLPEFRATRVQAMGGSCP